MRAFVFSLMRLILAAALASVAFTCRVPMAVPFRANFPILEAALARVFSTRSLALAVMISIFLSDFQTAFITLRSTVLLRVRFTPEIGPVVRPYLLIPTLLPAAMYSDFPVVLEETAAAPLTTPTTVVPSGFTVIASSVPRMPIVATGV